LLSEAIRGPAAALAKADESMAFPQRRQRLAALAAAVAARNFALAVRSESLLLSPSFARP
jgi:hypothetical protein